jgi:predicted kinase
VPKLEILIGPIASGKSTYARWRADRGSIVVGGGRRGSY